MEKPREDWDLDVLQATDKTVTYLSPRMMRRVTVPRRDGDFKQARNLSIRGWSTFHVIPPEHAYLSDYFFDEISCDHRDGMGWHRDGNTLTLATNSLIRVAFLVDPKEIQWEPPVPDGIELNYWDQETAKYFYRKRGLSVSVGRDLDKEGQIALHLSRIFDFDEFCESEKWEHKVFGDTHEFTHEHECGNIQILCGVNRGYVD